MAAQKTTIEFLPQEEWEKTKFGQILKWALTVGRYIVIFTELIVISAFLMRFKIDRDLTDLHEDVKQKVAVISAGSDIEKNFRFLQRRLVSTEKIRKEKIPSEEVVSELAAIVPIDVSFSQLEMTGGKISLSATALSESGLATLINNLKASSRFQNIYLSQITSGKLREIGITFSITAEVANLAEVAK